MKRILLVEDDEGIREALGLIVIKAGHELLACETGEQILAQEIDPPDLFVLDKQMPGMSGLHLCRTIKTSGKYMHVPVIMLSADPDIVKLAKEAGADAAITKPFSLKTFREMLAKYMAD